jgi:hypothetical protein
MASKLPSLPVLCAALDADHARFARSNTLVRLLSLPVRCAALDVDDACLARSNTLVGLLSLPVHCAALNANGARFACRNFRVGLLSPPERWDHSACWDILLGLPSLCRTLVLEFSGDRPDVL